MLKQSIQILGNEASHKASKLLWGLEIQPLYFHSSPYLNQKDQYAHWEEQEEWCFQLSHGKWYLHSENRNSSHTNYVITTRKYTHVLFMDTVLQLCPFLYGMRWIVYWALSPLPFLLLLFSSTNTCTLLHTFLTAYSKLGFNLQDYSHSPQIILNDPAKLQMYITSNHTKPQIISTKLLISRRYNKLSLWDSNITTPFTENILEIKFKLASFVKPKQLKWANLLFRWKWNMCTFVVTVPVEIKQFSVELFIVQYYDLQYELCQHSERSTRRTFLSVLFLMK